VNAIADTIVGLCSREISMAYMLAFIAPGLTASRIDHY
jgi:hypothetical protein